MVKYLWKTLQKAYIDYKNAWASGHAQMSANQSIYTSISMEYKSTQFSGLYHQMTEFVFLSAVEDSHYPLY